MGLIGIKGITGLPGFKGMKGKTGLAGLKGDRGPIGSTGLPGINGSRGDIGPKGDRGTPGSEGAKGANGSMGLPGIAVPIIGGVTYEWWGTSSCRDGAELVYTGRTGSTPSRHQGGGANYICMPHDPEYSLPFRSGVQGYSIVYGTEYESSIVGSSQYNAVCAMCYAAVINTVIKIPARTACLDGWTMEYYGYLMSEKFEINNLYGRFCMCV